MTKNQKKTKEFEYTDRAMGTEYSVAIVCHSQKHADHLFELAKQDIQSFENRFSRFLPHSELSKLNAEKDLVVSKVFLEVIEKAYELFVETRGIFNPLVQISRFGYDKNFDDINFSNNGKNAGLHETEPYDIDFSTVTIDRKNSRIQLKEGQKLDFGGFLKGYVAETIAKKIKSYSSDIAGVIVNIGGDLHTQGVDENGNKFLFDIYNPIDESKSVFVTLHNQSLATSGIYKRSWINSGNKVHHILDASGEQNPMTETVSASVIHEDGARAEAYAKVFLSMNPADSVHLLGDKNVSFVVTNTQGEVIKNIP